MATLTQDQIAKLKQSGLNDGEISSLAQKNGFSMPTAIPKSNTLNSSQIFSMKQKGLSDTDITTLAQKNGYGLPNQSQDGFIKSTAKDIAKTLVVKPAIRLAQALGGVAAYTFGNDQQKANYNKTITQDVQVPGLGITVEGQRKFGEGGATQIASDALKSGSYLYGGQGAGKVASGLVKGQVARSIGTGVVSGAIGGGAYGASEGLQDPNATVGSVAAQTAIGSVAGGVTGGTLSGAGALIKPIYKTVKLGAGKTKLLFASPEDKGIYILQKREGELKNIVGNNSSLRKVVASAERQGHNPINDLANSDLLVGTVSKDGRINGQLLQERFNEIIAPTENVIKKNFQETGESISLDQVQARMKEVLDSDYVPSKIYKQVQSKYDDIVYGLYKKGKVTNDEAGNAIIKFADLQQEKIDAYKLSNFLDPEKTLTDKAIGRAFKNTIDMDSTSIENLGEINRELSRYLSVKSLIDKLDQKIVKGGKLGKYFARGVGAVAGLPFGPLGPMAGAEIGGQVQGQILKGTFGKAVGKDFIKKSDVLENAIQKGKGYSNQVEARQIPQTNNANATNNVIPKIVQPTGKKSSLPQNLQDRKETLQAQIDYFKDSPLNKLQKYESKNYPGQLPELNNTGKGKFNKKGDVIASEVFNTNPDYSAGDALDATQVNEEFTKFITAKRNLKKEVEKLNQEIRDYKSGKQIGLNDKVPTDVADAFDYLHKIMVGPSIPSKYKYNATTGELVDYFEKMGLDSNLSELIPRLQKGGYTKIGDMYITDSGFKTKSQLEQIWKEANAKTSTKQGMTAINPLTVGAGVTAIGAGATGLVNSMSNKSSTPQTEPQKATPQPVKKETINADKALSAIAYVESRGVKNPYSFAQSSGDSSLGRALGKYQVTEGELKTYAKRFLDRTITAKEFLANPKLQDEYIKAKIKHYEGRGLTLKQILAVHNKGGGDLTPEGLNKTLAKAGRYVDDALSQYNQ